MSHPCWTDIDDQSAMLRFLVSEANRGKIEASKVERQEREANKLKADGVGGVHSRTKVQSIKAGGGVGTKAVHWGGMRAESI